MIGLVVFLMLLGCILMVAAVLVQNPKGGGLGTAMGGLNNNMFGVQRTTDFLERTTWYFGGGVLVMCLLTSMFKPHTVASTTKGVEKHIETPLEKQLKKAKPQ